MKKITLSFIALGLLCTSYGFINQPKKPKKNPVAAANQDKKNDKKKAKEDAKMPSPEEMQKVMMEYGTPGEMHKMLAQANGKWTAVTTMWMAPNTDPTKSEGSCENEMIMDGKYQLSKFKGNMMGMPFEGMGILGFDNATQEFTNTWIDNMGSGTMTMKGKWNAEKRTIELKGKMVDPMSKSEMPCRETFTMKDENTQMLEMYCPNPDGKGEYKMMEIMFTRG